MPLSDDHLVELLHDTSPSAPPDRLDDGAVRRQAASCDLSGGRRALGPEDASVGVLSEVGLHSPDRIVVVVDPLDGSTTRQGRPGSGPACAIDRDGPRRLVVDLPHGPVHRRGEARVDSAPRRRVHVAGRGAAGISFRPGRSGGASSAFGSAALIYAVAEARSTAT
jgi:hypothetical protein